MIPVSDILRLISLYIVNENSQRPFDLKKVYHNVNCRLLYCLLPFVVSLLKGDDLKDLIATNQPEAISYYIACYHKTMIENPEGITMPFA